MPEDAENKVTPNAIKYVTDSPMILDKVEYMYVSYSQVSANSVDFRVAFGDRIPPEGNVKATRGVVMTHEHARALLKVLAESVSKIDNLLQQVDPNKGTGDDSQT